MRGYPPPRESAIGLTPRPLVFSIVHCDEAGSDSPSDPAFRVLEAQRAPCRLLNFRVRSVFQHEKTLNQRASYYARC
jgi:hypothetical protein